MSKSNSTRFQWAALHIGDLVKFKREKDVRQYLQSLPKGLKKAYDEIYNNIQSREGSAGEIATRAFQWLMCSWRPLHPEELVLAVYQDPAGDFEFEADFDIDYVLEACHNLIVVAHEARRKGEEEDGTNYNLVCRFSHLSVQEYFEQNHWSRDDCHTIAACTCLRYLTNDTLLHSIERANSVRDAFSTIHGYVDGWFNHVRDFDNTDFSEEIKRMLDIFLGDDPYGTTTYYIDWIRHADLVQISPTNFWKGGIAHRIITAGVTPPILARDICQPVYSALCGCICMELTPIIGHWLVEDRLQPDAEVSGEKLLAVASSFEDIRLCKAFIDSGADVNAPSLRLGSALQAALEGHFHDPMNVGIVELLLENGADVNMAAGRCGTALQRAAWRSPPRRHILQLLLDRGANVNASQGEMGTVLQLTAYNKTFMKDPQACHEALSYLIGHGADVNVVAGTLGSALQGVAALGDSHIAAAMLLLDHGADVNQISGEFGTALQAAAWKGSQGLSTTMLLLGRGADANLVGGKFGTALQAAVISADKLDFEELTREQWQEIPLSSLQQPMSLLLKAGADVMIRGGKYGTALQAAAIKRTRELRVLEFFLQYLSGTQIADDELGAALRRAAANGDDAKPALAVLLEHGADVNATDPNEGTALHAAARTSRGIETAKYLLDCGADIHACCTLHGTPLHAAVASGEGGEDLVGYLIDRGANVHAIGGPFETVLQAAAASLQVSRGTINLLMKWEVDLNAKGGKYGTAIRAAFHNNHCPWEYKYEIMSKFMSSGAEFAANDFGLDPMTSEDTMLKDLRRILRVGGLDTPQISEIYDTRTRHPSAEPVLPRAPIRTRFYHIL
jgi:ankyrin repeat protein